MAGINLLEGYVFRVLARMGVAAAMGTGSQFLEGELGWDTDKKVFRVGDGTALPPRIMSDKSTGTFDFSAVTWAKFGEIRITAGKTVDGVKLATLNGAAGFPARINSDGTFANRSLISGDATLSITDGDGVAGNPDIRVSAQLITLLTPPYYTAQAAAPSSPKKGDFWQDTDEGTGERVYVRGFLADGTTPKWIQVSNDFLQASEVDVGITRYATPTEAAAKQINTAAVTPRGMLAIVGAGVDFRPVKNATLTAPPGSPAIGDSYLVATGASGAWNTHDGKITVWNGSNWIFETLRLGAVVIDTNAAITSPLRYLIQNVALTWVSWQATTANVGATRLATQAEMDGFTNALNPATPSVIFNSLVIDTAITKTVHGTSPDFANLIDAYVWLSRRKISSTGSVTLDVRAGTFTYPSGTYRLNHPNGARIFIRGQALTGGGFPSYSAFQALGNSVGQRATDGAANLALLQARFTTIFNLADTTLTFDNIGAFDRILCTGVAANGRDGIIVTSGAFTDVAVHGFGNRGLTVSNGIMAVDRVVGVMCTATGISVESGSILGFPGTGGCAGFNCGTAGVALNASSSAAAGNPICGSGNGGQGVLVQNGGYLRGSGTGSTFANYNAQNGFLATTNSVIDVAGAVAGNNTFTAFSADLCSLVIANSTSGSGNGAGYVASRGSYIVQTSGGAGTLSPASNTVGNNNSYMQT